MGRKRIKALEPDLDKDEFDEEAVKEIYTSKEYVPPNSSDLETIYEQEPGSKSDDHEEARAGSRRKCFVDASGKMSKAPRRIETKYWLEDKEKDKKRKQMTAKLFKGRKKVKFGGLSQKQEEKLMRIIESKDEVIYDTENDSTMQKRDSEEYSTKPSKGRAKSRRSKEPLQEIKRPSESPKKSLLIVAEIIPGEPNVEPDHRGVEPSQSSNVEVGRLSVDRYSDELAWAPLPKTPTQRQIDEKSVTSTLNGEKSSVKSNKRRSSRRRSSIFKPVNRATKDDEEKENDISGSASSLPAPVESDEEQEQELAKRILEADSLFGPIGFEETEKIEEEKVNNVGSTRSKSGSNRKSIDKKSQSPVKDKIATTKSRVRRSSVMSTQKVNVRRSSRFFQHSNADDNTDIVVGSVYQEMTVQMKKKLSEEMNSNPPNPERKMRRSSCGGGALSSVENIVVKI